MEEGALELQSTREAVLGAGKGRPSLALGASAGNVALLTPLLFTQLKLAFGGLQTSRTMRE